MKRKDLLFMKYKKTLLCLFVIFAMVLSIIINNPIIMPSALEDEEITEELTDETEEEVEKEIEEIPCDHEWGDWSVTKEPTESETGLKVRGCNKCSATQEETIPVLEDVEEIENVEKEEYLKEEDAILDLDTDLLGKVKGDTEEKKNETTTIYLSVRFDGFGGSAVFTAYDGESNTIVTKTVSGDSNPTLKIPSGEYVKIVCQLTGENASKAKTTFYNASGVFNNESYYLNVKITYKAPCSHINTTLKTKKEATYKSGGVMEEICDDCGKIVSSQKTAKLTCSHVDVEKTTIREASETHAGIISKKCKQCGKFLGTEEQSKTEHKHDYKSSSIAASCDKNGYKINVCTICGDVKIIETIDKLPHTFNEGVITKNPDCTHDGIKTFTCSVCGATKQEAVVATGHTYNETSRTEPT